MIALGRAVGEKPRALRAVRVRRKRLGALVRRRRRARVDALDVLRDIQQQSALADRRKQPGVDAFSALVAGHVEAQRSPEAVRGDRLQVRCGRLGRRLPGLVDRHLADFSRYARMKPSRSPSSTRAVSPISKSVRWSLTIE